MSVYINGWGSISALGASKQEAKARYADNTPSISFIETGSQNCGIYITPVGTSIAQFTNDSLEAQADRIHRLALTAAKDALSDAGWSESRSSIPVCIGSARGATGTLEKAIAEFHDSTDHKVKPWTSPLTTAGNISAFISKELKLGAAFSSSMTCASALESLLTAYALLSSKMHSRCLAGGAEAPLTPFGIAQMQALRIYSSEKDRFPCKPCAHEKQTKHAFALGEGAALFALDAERTSSTKAEILSMSSMVDAIESPTGMDSSGETFAEVMRKALESAGLKTVDALIVHAPGTSLGDRAELSAIDRVFKESPPALFTTKHLTGHTFGASGALSLELALFLLEGFVPSPLPYCSPLSTSSPKGPISTVLLNCAGFGGVVGSIVLRKV